MTVVNDVDREHERIIQAATRLFSALGFDATTTELIADAASVSVATVRMHFGCNAELYRAVMRQASRDERKAMAESIAAFTPTRQGMDRILDAYLDFYASRPDLLGLWLHRRTGDAADTVDLDESHTKPRLAWLVNAIQDDVPDPKVLDYALWTFPWVVSGFLGYGMIHSDGRMSRRFDQPVKGLELEAFRHYLHTLAHQVLALPDADERS